MIPDQVKMWDKKHLLGEHSAFRHEHSLFATLVEPRLPRVSRILDLGCGVGRDANLFAEYGHQVLATDFSSEVIKQNRKIFKRSNLEFQVMDMSEPMPYESETFNVVYANLSIHYFSHTAVQNIISEIMRLLKPGGLFCFACKSPKDSYHGEGEEIEDNYFISSKGHARHFFSKEYTKDLMKDAFIIEMLDEVSEEYIGRRSTYVRCVAKLEKRR